jgi:hypothetical protein
MTCCAAVVRRTAIRAVLAAALLTASSACTSSSADRASSGATVPTEPATTTTTNPYAVPAVIDAAYVNRVLAGLDAIRGDASRLVVQTRTIPRQAYDQLRSAFGADDALQLEIDTIQSNMRNGFVGYSPVPGNELATVKELIANRSTCIFARVTRDYSAIGPGASTASDRNWIALRRQDPNRDPNGYNHTGWAYVYDGFLPNRNQPPDPCGS